MSLQKVLDFESNLEEAFKNYFIKNGFEDVYTSRYAGDLPDNSVILKVTTDSVWENHVAGPSTTGTGNAEEDSYNMTLHIDLCTDRTLNLSAEGYTDAHAFRKSLIRKMMLFGAINGTLSGIDKLDLDYYQIFEWQFESDSGDQRDETLDGCLITYAFSIKILPSAWTS